MFKTNKTRKKVILSIILIAVFFIVFLVAKIFVRGNLTAASGGEILIPLLPLIIYLFISNWKLFKKTCFPKDTTFDDYFNEYFHSEDMIEDDTSKIINIEEFLSH